MIEARSRPLRILSIVGTRPEAIKMAPVVRAIEARPNLLNRVLLTGQHSNLAGFFCDIPQERMIELPYDPRDRSAPRLRETLHKLLCAELRREPADLVLVQGDTASAFAGALAARSCGFSIGHVEAGLRSFDLSQPWPEEGNRTAIDALSDILFAPTLSAAKNLGADWRVKGAVYVTGNSGIDALFQARRALLPSDTPPRRRKTILVTCHRKENQGAPLRSVCAALRRLVRDHEVEIVFPLHLNRHVRREVEALLGSEPDIHLCDPLEHGEMVRLMVESWLILTDSGGLQEEGPALGKPVLVLRNVTERGEAVASANMLLVGTKEDSIVAAVASLLADPERYAAMSRPSFPFGDGQAAPRIVEAIEHWAGRGASAARNPYFDPRPSPA